MRTDRAHLAPLAGLLRGIAAAAWIVASICPNALAEEAKPLRGVALVLGQSKYEHVPTLANPENDARKIEALLDTLGFETDIGMDRTARRLKRDLEAFVEDAEGADVALVYYSGHGIEAGGENYMLPVDASLESLDDAEENLASLSRLLDDLRTRVKIAIVLLDACRTNPFPSGTAVRTGPGEPATPIGSTGLAATKGAESAFLAADPEDIEERSLGEVIGFAAAPRQAALDGVAGGNSPYAAALLKHLAAGGLEFGQVMTLVAEEVYLSTRGRQQPWTNASLRRLLFFGETPEEESGDEALIRGERRSLLLTIAATPDDLRRTVETIAAADEVPLDGLYAMLKTLGLETPDDPTDLDKQLRAGSAKLKGFLDERTALKSVDAEIVRLSGLADRAVQEGALQAAVTFHERAKTRVARLEADVGRAEADIKARRLEFGEVFAGSARTSELAFDYLNAANDWARAYEQVERWDDGLAFSYKLAHATALSSHGDYKGDNDALKQAIGLYQDALLLVPRETHRDDWARTQNDLGVALQGLGERESSPERLEEAVAAYRAALEEWTRERMPFQWAIAQNNLGHALQGLGERESGPERLEEAVAAYRAALEEFTREREPLNWATAQTNLGNALQKLGERESGPERLEEAVVAYRAVLDERIRARVPLQWALTQVNLGNVLALLGGRESSAGRVEEAIDAYRAALEENTRARVPLQWALTLTNLGNALQMLGRLDGRPERLEEAAAAYRAALEEQTRDRVPLAWATVQINLGNVLAAIGEQQGDTGLLEEAVAAYGAALEEFTRERVPVNWAAVQNNLGSALRMLGERTGDTERLEEAVVAFRAALEEWTRERVPFDWAMTQNNIGTALATLGEREGGTERLEEAVAAYRAALQEWTLERVPLQWALTQDRLGWVLKILGERKGEISLVLNGREGVIAAWEFSRLAGYDSDGYFLERLAEFDRVLGELQ